MFSFMKNWLTKDSVPGPENKEPIKEESVLQTEEASLPAEQESKAPSNSNVRDTPLSLHPNWETQFDTQQRYAFSFMATELEPIQVGNLSLAGLRLVPHEKGIEVLAFVRNGLPRPYQFEKMNLVILFGDNQLFARQEFDMSEIGEIPPFSARPWVFIFPEESFLIQNALLDNWKLAFEIAQKKMVLPQQLELEESWIKALNDAQKNQLIDLAKRLPALKAGEVNVQSVQLSKAEDESYRAMLLFRNGSDKTLSFEKLPLALYDATGEVVARGSFEVGGLTVNPGTSKPWLFIFPKESIQKTEADLTRWKVAVIQ